MSQEKGSSRGAENAADTQKKELENFSSFLETAINSDEFTADSFRKFSEQVKKITDNILEHGDRAVKILDDIGDLHFELADNQGSQASAPDSFEKKARDLKNKLKELQELVKITLAGSDSVDVVVEAEAETAAEFPGQKEFEKRSGFVFEPDRVVFPLGIGDFKIKIPGYTLDPKKPFEFFNSAFGSEGSATINYVVDGKPATISIETKPQPYLYRITAWRANRQNSEWSTVDLGETLKGARNFLIGGLLPDAAEQPGRTVLPPPIPEAAKVSPEPVDNVEPVTEDPQESVAKEFITKAGKKIDLRVDNLEFEFNPAQDDPHKYEIFYFEPGQEPGQERGWNFTFSIDEEKKEFSLLHNDNNGEVHQIFSTIEQLVQSLQKIVREASGRPDAEYARTETDLSKLNFTAKELGQIIPETALQELYASMLKTDDDSAKDRFADIFDNQSHADNSVITKRLDAAGLVWEDFVVAWKNTLAEKVYHSVEETVRQEMSRLAEKKLTFLDKVKALKNPVLYGAFMNGLFVGTPANVLKVILKFSGAEAAIGYEATNSLVGAVGGMTKRIIGRAGLPKIIQGMTKRSLDTQSKKYEEQILAELFAENSNKKAEMGSWIAQALREVNKEQSEVSDSDPAHVAIFRQEAAKRLAAEAAQEESESGSVDTIRETERKAQLEALLAGLQAKQVSEQVTLESKPAWQKWAQTTLDTLSGKLWLPKKGENPADSKEKKSFFSKERLGDAAAVVVGATVGYAFSAGTEVTRLALTTVTGAAAGFETGRKKDVVLANERFISDVKKEVNHLGSLISADNDGSDSVHREIASSIIRLHAMSTESVVQQDKGLSSHIRETLAEAMPIVSENLLQDLNDTSAKLQEQIKKQEERLTNERTKGWKKVLYGIGGAVTGFVAGLGINSVMEKIHTALDSKAAQSHSDSTTDQSPEDIEVEGAMPVYRGSRPQLRTADQLPELEERSLPRGPESNLSQARGLDESPDRLPQRDLDEPPAPATARELEVGDRGDRQPLETKSSGYSEILSVEAKKGSSTSGLLDKLKKTELASYTSTEQKNAWAELIANKTKFHNWKVEQLQNMGYTHENGVGFTGHPMAIHKGADLKVVWDADNQKFVAGFGDEHVTKYAHTHVRDVHPVAPEVAPRVETPTPASPATTAVTEFRNNPEFKTEVTHNLDKDLVGSSAHHEILDIQPNPKNPDQVLVNLGGDGLLDNATGEVTYRANHWMPAEVTRLPDGRLSLSAVGDVVVPASTQGTPSAERVVSSGGNGGGSAASTATETNQSTTQIKDGKSASVGGAESGNRKADAVETKPEPAVRRPAQDKGAVESRRDFEDTPDDVKRGDALQDVESDYQELNWTKGEKASFNNYLRFASWQNDLLGAKGSGLEKIVADNGLANVKDPAVKQWLTDTKTDLLQRQNNVVKILEDGVNSKKDFIKIRSELRRASMFGVNQISENTQLSDTPANLNFYKDNILLPHLKKTFEPIQEGLDLKTVNGK